MAQESFGVYLNHHADIGGDKAVSNGGLYVSDQRRG